MYRLGPLLDEVNQESQHSIQAVIDDLIFGNLMSRSDVEKSGGVFIPLVVETLGIWTLLQENPGPIHNGQQATVNLLQQLSAKIWCFNAKMLLRYIALRQSVPLWDAPL